MSPAVFGRRWETYCPKSHIIKRSFYKWKISVNGY